MKAYVIFEDTFYFIHKHSTCDNVKWTQEESEAKQVFSWKESVEFFFDELGFSLSTCHPHYLRILKD